MKPMPDQIRVLRDEVFTSAGALSPLAAQNDATALMQADQARVSILNGSFSPGLDSSTGAFLQAQGVSVVGIGTADRAYDRTTIILHSGKLYTLRYFQALFGITDSAQVIIQPDPASQVDVEVRLGNDWANNNPMP